MAWNGSGSAAIDSTKHKGVKARTSGRTWMVIAGLVAIVVLGGIVFGRVGTKKGDAEHSVGVAKSATSSEKKIRANPKRYAQSSRDAVRNAMPKTLAKGRSHKQKSARRGPVEMYAHLEGEDRKLAESVQAALDADDLTATIPAAQAALKSENAEVRQTAVEALGWFGASALPELTGCLADPDEDVRQTAQNQWELALQEVEKPSDQFNIAAAAFATISGEDALTSLGGILSNAATDMIDGEEDEAKAAKNRITVLQALVDIIEGGQPQNVAAAKEAYNDITCNEWISVDEAERYLADPENYDPDEPSPVGEDAAAEASNENPVEESDNQDPAESPQDGESAADQDDANE